MGYLFIGERLVVVDDHSITATDSTVLKANDTVWHKSSYMEKGGIVSRSGIYIDAKCWDYSHTKGGVFGYKIQFIPTTGDLVVPLLAEVTAAAANVPNNKMYIPHPHPFLYYLYHLYRL